MRQKIRAALKRGRERVAVVCGAWHAPVLRWPLPPAAADVRTLRGAPRRKITLTWVPWTHQRLASATGYGAGVASPGWYHHLWVAPDQPIVRWLAKVAQALRDARPSGIQCPRHRGGPARGDASQPARPAAGRSD